MLPKNKRIPRALFSVFRGGSKSYKSNLLLLRVALTEGQETKASFSVSKKVSKSAVVRNKIRRLGYEAIASYLPKIRRGGILLGFSFLKTPKDSAEVSESIKLILQSANLTK